MKQNMHLCLPDEDFTCLLTARALSFPAHSDQSQVPSDHKASFRTGRVMVPLPEPERSFLNLYFRIFYVSTMVMMVRNMFKIGALAPQKLLNYAEWSIKTVSPLFRDTSFIMSSTAPPYTFQYFSSFLMALLKFQDLSSSSLACVPSPLSLPELYMP